MFVILLLPLLLSCEVIPEGEQVIPVEPTTSDASVLLVEFSGVGCVNCPYASAEAARLEEAYREQLIVVEMHPADNPFTTAQPRYDYTCDAANEYYRYFGGKASTPFPTGVINFSQSNDSYFIDYPSWGSVVTQALRQPGKANFTLSTRTDAATRTLLTEISDIKGDGVFVLWLIEDSVIGAQSMPDGTIKTDYVHNHLLRETIGGIWGDNRLTAEFTIPDKYDIYNCAVVALMLDGNREVQAVRRSRLQPLSDTPLTLTIDGIGEINSNTIITVTDVETNALTSKPQMSLTGMLLYNGVLWVTIEREQETEQDQLCCGDKCVYSNGKKTQKIDFSISGLSYWYTHFNPEENQHQTISYTFNSESIHPLKLIVNYNPKQ